MIFVKLNVLAKRHGQKSLSASEKTRSRFGRVKSYGSMHGWYCDSSS